MNQESGQLLENNALNNEAKLDEKETLNIYELSQRDQEFLLTGGSNIVRQILRDFPGELPTTIILPDTTARPLYYFFKPILEKVAESRNVSMPKFHFIHPLRKGEN